VSSTTSPTQWLLDNLHNPYPPTAVKRTIEESPELGGRTVNEWFARARQGIGWTRLLRDRFGGCRSAATDAAFRAFVRDDPRSPLDAELHAAFVAVRAHANLVYTPPSPGTLGSPHGTPLTPYRSFFAYSFGATWSIGPFSPNPPHPQSDSSKFPPEPPQVSTPFTTHGYGPTSTSDPPNPSSGPGSSIALIAS